MLRAIIAIVLLLLPELASAQRMPRIGRRGPTRPAPLPPQPPTVAREMAYKRLRLSVETYPLISYVRSPGYISNGFESTWTTFGMGTRADYRVVRNLSATLDITSSFMGGPALTETAELGMRLRPEPSERRIYPFADVRVGYVYAYNTQFRPIEDAFSFPPTTEFVYGPRFSHGFGGVGGLGMEFALTRRFSLTTAASVLRNRMTSRGFDGTTPSDSRYSMTWYRGTLGIRYNPVRQILPPTGLP